MTDTHTPMHHKRAKSLSASFLAFNKSAPNVDVGMCLVRTLHANRSILKQKQVAHI